eukprot:TRINITY_DN3142_c0_g9_i1.p1 TRINITY_DN3142_c0_g9~~TRINITY_DN3142_c0_g9_i1.p1  ORF type:complete len:186 (-),score=31.82 TRINITY_DN3142_c0_g9_i1:97-654(-)
MDRISVAVKSVGRNQLSKEDRRVFGQLAKSMDYFHSHFRSMWNSLADACKPDAPAIDSALSARLVATGMRFCTQLEFHHGIEESVLYPKLSVKMSAFLPGDVTLLAQHKTIHQGLEELSAYLRQLSPSNSSHSNSVLVSKDQLKAIMDRFGETLWNHMDAEVEALSAEEMHRYWTREEMRQIMHF